MTRSVLDLYSTCEKIEKGYPLTQFLFLLVANVIGLLMKKAVSDNSSSYIMLLRVSSSLLLLILEFSRGFIMSFSWFGIGFVMFCIEQLFVSIFYGIYREVDPIKEIL